MRQQLSKLQRRILCLLLQEKFITCQEFLGQLWGCQSQGRRTVSDKARYASAHACLSRSLTRLWARGLLEYWQTLSRYRTAVTLTEEGKLLAQAIFEEEQGRAI